MKFYAVVGRFDSASSFWGRVDGSSSTPSMRWAGHTQEMAAKDDNLGMPSMTAELSTRAVLSVAASVVEGSKQGDISDAVKSRLLV